MIKTIRRLGWPACVAWLVIASAIVLLVIDMASRADAATPATGYKPPVKWCKVTPTAQPSSTPTAIVTPSSTATPTLIPQAVPKHYKPKTWWKPCPTHTASPTATPTATATSTPTATSSPTASTTSSPSTSPSTATPTSTATTAPAVPVPGDNASNDGELPVTGASVGGLLLAGLGTGLLGAFLVIGFRRKRTS